jgi:hypothetical protein
MVATSIAVLADDVERRRVGPQSPRSRRDRIIGSSPASRWALHIAEAARSGSVLRGGRAWRGRRVERAECGWERRG